jgi:vacuolar-type H+-ATPase subunit I/STV1
VIDVSEDSKAAEDWMDVSYAIPTDVQMLATHNANENRKNKHLLGILHNMVLDGNYHGKHESNTLRKQHNEHAKALSAVVAKTAESVQRIVALESTVIELKEIILKLQSDNLQLQERIDGHEKRLDKQGTFLNTLRSKGEAE